MLSTTFPHTVETPIPVISSEVEVKVELQRSTDQSITDCSTIIATITNPENNSEQNDKKVEMLVEVKVTLSAEAGLPSSVVVLPSPTLSDNVNDGKSIPKGEECDIGHASLDTDRFDFILMDIQMPVMGESNYLSLNAATLT